MKFDGRTFLEGLAEAYNARDPIRLCSFFALDDHRFSLFEEFSGELLYGNDYKPILSLAEEATGAMSFEMLECREYGEYALLHAIQCVKVETNGDPNEEIRVRATFFVSLGDGGPRILTGHYSSMMLCFPKRESAIRWRNLG